MKLFKTLLAISLIVMLASCSTTKCTQPGSCGAKKTYRVKSNKRSKPYNRNNAYTYHKRKSTFNKKKYNH